MLDEYLYGLGFTEEQTKQIRSIYIKILKYIEKYEFSDSSEIEESNILFDGLEERIKEIASIKQIEHIETIEEFNIAAYRANKPLES